jgi:tetratricopeptide (TPR) repeat protein
MPPAPDEVRTLLAAAQIILNDRSMPFHHRIKSALEKADEAAQAYPECPQVLLFRGTMRYQNLDYHFAHTDFERLRELYPDVIDIVPALARIAMEIGDFEHSSEMIENLLKDNPDSPALIALKSEWLEKKGVHGEAAETLKNLLPETGGPGSPDVRNAIARLLLEDENPSSAIEILQPLIDESVQNPETYRIYGDAFAELDRLDDARDAYRSALHIDPGNMKAHYNLAVLLREMGRRDRARDELEIVASTEPNDADAHFQLFEIALEDNDTQAALNHALHYLINAEEIEADDPALVFIDESAAEFGPAEVLLYGKYLIESGEFGSAAELLAPFTENPDIAPPFEVLMSLVMTELDRTDDALSWTDKALDHYEEDFEGFIVCDHPNPPDEVDGGDFAELICRKAELHLARGETDQASETLDELGSDDSLAHKAFRILGEISYVKKDYHEALEHFHSAIDEYPADVDALASLAATYYKSGDHIAAINYYLRAHLNDNEDIPIVRSLVELYMETERFREARLFLEKYAALEDEDEGLAWAEQQLLKLG